MERVGDARERRAVAVSYAVQFFDIEVGGYVLGFRVAVQR